MSDELLKRFAARLRRQRAARGWTQEEAAERTGLSVDSIRRMESGRMAPSLISLHKLATGYATDLALLAGADVTNLQSHQLAQLVEFAATLRADELAALLRVAEAIFGHR